MEFTDGQFSRRPSFIPALKFFERFDRHCTICERAIMMHNLDMISSAIKVVSSLATYYVEEDKKLIEVTAKIKEAEKEMKKAEDLLTDSDNDSDTYYEANILRKNSFDMYHEAYSTLMYICAKGGLQLAFKKKNQKLKTFGEVNDESDTTNDTTSEQRSDVSSGNTNTKSKTTEDEDDDKHWTTV